INQTESYYEDLVNSVNGVLFPGGAASFKTKNGYADAAWTLYKLAIRKNQAGEYFPVWGTCLGFELLSFLATQQVNILTNCEAENVAMPLQFKPDFGTSKMFGEAPDNIIQILETENVTANYHHFCITETNFTTAGLSRDWRVISVNKDVNDLEFISSFEHKQYPIYGVQFHPEKNTYEWKVTNNNPHSANAILAEEFFADFFVNEARKSSHHFPTQRDEEQALIYNFQPEYTGWNGSSFEQIYFF
ncbi:Gamma-glutamyl hydrolase, partial [Blattella germanica]